MRSKKTGLTMVACASALGLAAAIGLAPSAQASSSSCPSGNFCAWDAPSYTGTPFLITSYNVNGGTIDVADNITSSGYNKRTTGGAYCGWDTVWPFEEELWIWNPNSGATLPSNVNNQINYFKYGSAGC